jgi:lipoprotein-releasing system ATP-binding protein
MADRLIVSDISKSYSGAGGANTVLRGVSLEATPGATVAIVGPSGSGKSTLLNIIGSLDKPTSGSVRLGDTEVTALDGKLLSQFRSTQVGFVFQDHHLLPQLTAVENVLLPTIASGGGDEFTARAILERMGVGILYKSQHERLMAW